MSRFKEVKVKCAVCGNEICERLMLSSNSFGYADLDFRPAGMLRYAMGSQVNYCPNCGYSNYDVNKLNYPNAKEYIKSEEYQAVINNQPDWHARKFYLLAMIQEHNNVLPSAQYNYLRAAWFYDDIGEKKLAKQSRIKSIACYLLIKELTIEDYLVLIDMYRRIREFNKALETIDAVKKMDLDGNENKETILKMLVFQKELCLAKDIDCYSIEDAIKGKRHIHETKKPKTLEEQYQALLKEIHEIDARIEEIDKEEMIELEEAFNDGKISRKEYEKRLEELNKEYFELVDKTCELTKTANDIAKKIHERN